MDKILTQSIEILERTPRVLTSLLQNLSPEWTTRNEGGETWTVYDVVGHLVIGELTDWIPRMDIILSDQPNKEFPPFDRFAQAEYSKGKTLTHLLLEFEALRRMNLQHLRSLNISAADLEKTGIHPAFGAVSLQQLLSTWTVHDLNHLAQISRVMASQYIAEVGPWVAYLRILQS